MGAAPARFGADQLLDALDGGERAVLDLAVAAAGRPAVLVVPVAEDRVVGRALVVLAARGATVLVGGAIGALLDQAPLDQAPLDGVPLAGPATAVARLEIRPAGAPVLATRGAHAAAPAPHDQEVTR